MKRLFILIFIAFIVLKLGNISTTWAVDKDTTDSAEIPQERLEKIKMLKERVATKVAQLRQNEKWDLLAGEIVQASSSGVIVTSMNQDTRITLADDGKITLLGDTGKTMKLADLSNGQLILAQGKKERQDFTADQIWVQPKRQILIAKISAIDKANATILLAVDAGSVTVDVEKATKTTRLEKDNTIARSGFSKLNIGDNVHVIATPTDDPKRLTAIRILSFPALSASPTLVQKVATPSGKPISPGPQ